MRRHLLQLGIVALICAAYVGYVTYSRRQANHRLEEESRQQQARNLQLPTALAGDSINILNFYATPGIVRRNQKAELCYGVANAQSVQLDPPVADLHPALSRCIDVEPRETTRYTLTARDKAGRTASQTLEIKVR